MGQEHPDMGHGGGNKQIQTRTKSVQLEDFVLEKSIFNNIFEKDIRRVFIYKKAERLAKALHLISPAFIGSVSLKNRIDTVAIGLVDSAMVQSGVARATLSRELLALSSILSIARTGGLLSHMNTDLIAREAHILLQEIAEYEEPRVFLEEAPTLSDIAKSTASKDTRESQNLSIQRSHTLKRPAVRIPAEIDKGHLKDRREAIMSVIRNKQKASIKDISTLIRGVSEKTIQRELASLIKKGLVMKEGERRWSTYSII